LYNDYHAGPSPDAPRRQSEHSFQSQPAIISLPFPAFSIASRLFSYRLSSGMSSLFPLPLNALFVLHTTPYMQFLLSYFIAFRLALLEYTICIRTPRSSLVLYRLFNHQCFMARVRTSRSSVPKCHQHSPLLTITLPSNRAPGCFPKPSGASDTVPIYELSQSLTPLPRVLIRCDTTRTRLGADCPNSSPAIACGATTLLTIHIDHQPQAVRPPVRLSRIDVQR